MEDNGNDKEFDSNISLSWIINLVKDQSIKNQVNFVKLKQAGVITTFSLFCLPNK